MRGRKPKPSFLKLVTGNAGKRPVFADPAPAIAPDFDNGIAPPRKLRKRQRELWDTFIRRAPWLTVFDVPKAHLWVELHAEFERAPAKMIAGMIAQLRALGSELGLDPSSRARLAATQPERPHVNNGAEKYFR